MTYNTWWRGGRGLPSLIALLFMNLDCYYYYELRLLLLFMNLDCLRLIYPFRHFCVLGPDVNKLVYIRCKNVA